MEDSVNTADLDTDDQWSVVIEPVSPWFDLRLREVGRYRDLVFLLVHRDFVAQFKQTILGPLWHIIQPLLTTVVFTIVFGKFAGLPTDGLPQFLFYMAGNVIWVFFSKSFTSTSNTFVGNAAIFGKVYFPRLVMPISRIISGLIAFGIQFGLFLFFMAFFYIRGAQVNPNMWILMFPILVLLMAVMGLSCGIIVSSATTKYRDLQQLVGFGTQLWMYATPVIYPLSTVPEKYRWMVLANPMTSVVESFRYGFLGSGTVNPGHLVYSVAVTLVLFLVGIMLFNRVERTFIDTV